MDVFQAVVGLVTVVLALPAIYFAAKAAKYARDTVMVTALESDLRRIDEAEDRASRLVGRMTEYADKMRDGLDPDLMDYIDPFLREWQNSFIRLPKRVQDALFIPHHWKPGELGMPLTGAEGWDINSNGEALSRAILEGHVRTAGQFVLERRKIEAERSAILDRTAG